MSIINAAKKTVSEDLMVNFFLSGRTITRVKSKRNCPKHLRYNSFSVNGKNHAPTFNPLKHTV